jgi:nucleoside-diphosphate-sugar epimerase
MKNIIVTGSSGFIGSHLVRKLKQQGHFVVGVDIVEPKYEKPHLFFNRDLRNQLQCREVFNSFHLKNGIDEVYNLACLMGGMGYIGDTKHSHDIMTGSTQIVANVIDCSIAHKVKKSFYSSSACVYNMYLQEGVQNISLKESDVFPAMPDLIYGWQKLMSELMYKAATQSHNLDVRIARFHNIFGHEGIWDGGKEKAPAAIARKVAQAKNGDAIEIWGDGSQVRSFLFISECLEGVERLMNSNFTEPINIGSDEVISINDLAKLIIKISGKNLSIANDLTKPQGVRGRNSDNTLIEKELGWKPKYSLEEGIKLTYDWIKSQANKWQ